MSRPFLLVLLQRGMLLETNLQLPVLLNVPELLYWSSWASQATVLHSLPAFRAGAPEL